MWKSITNYIGLSSSTSPQNNSTKFSQNVYDDNDDQITAVNAYTPPNRLPTKGYSKELPLCSLVLTVNSGKSFDALYTQVEQIPPEEGVAISLWQLSYSNVEHLLLCLQDKPKPDNVEEKNWEVFKEISQEYSSIDSESVLLNFECCGGCSSTRFPISPEIVFALVSLLLKRGCNIQFGDFSTKALIGQWDTSVLGPNPFRNASTFSSNFDLRFNPQTLMDSPCTQLVTVGQLCKEKGGAHLHAMGGTIRFTVDYTKTETTEYQLKILTVMTKADGVECDGNEKVTFKDETFKGSVGHCMLKYKAEGKDEEKFGYIFISAGHWIECSRLDTDVDAVRRTMADNWGQEKADQFYSEYQQMDVQKQECYMQKNAIDLVQTSATSPYKSKSSSSAKKTSFFK